MASAVIASQNESTWPHMGKIPYSSHNLNANPNPKPRKKQKQYHNGVGVGGRYHTNGDSPAVTQAASDDAYSFNQTSTSRNAANYGRYLTFNAASFTKPELIELRKRLSGELEQIRDLQKRIYSGIYSGQFSNTGNPRSHAKFKKISGNERSVAALGSVPDRPSNGVSNASIIAVDFGHLLKECRQIVAKLLKLKTAYLFKAPVDVKKLGLHDYYHIVKNPMDLGTVKAKLAQNRYPTPVEFAADVRLTFNNALLYNPMTDDVHMIAKQMLAQFEDLFRPIQGKFDSCVNQPREKEVKTFGLNEELQVNSWNKHNQINASPLRGKKVKPKASPVPAPLPQVSRKNERMQMPMQAHSGASTSSNPPLPISDHQQPKLEPVHSPVRVPTQEPVKEQKPVVRGVVQVKQPKPKARDPLKREMNMEEKHKLGLGLQSLPQEKMPQLVQIIKKRNEHLAQDGDEIELDIETLDTETIWELDRFVANCKKMVSKTKRQGLVVGGDPDDGIAAPSTPIVEADTGQLSDKNDDYVGNLKDDDEDVDIIDDDMPATSFPPVEIEKDEGAGIGGGEGQARENDDRGNASSSSSGSGSSSSDSSSSSGSDSGSSSDSGSDADDAQS